MTAEGTWSLEDAAPTVEKGCEEDDGEDVAATTEGGKGCDGNCTVVMGDDCFNFLTEDIEEAVSETGLT